MDQRHMGFLTREFVTVVFSVPPFAGEGGLGCVQAKGTRRRCRASLSVPIAAQMDPSSEPLYAQVEPYDSGFLKVSDVHTIYYEQSGNPQGHAAVFLHGGPGAGTSPGNRRFFDPQFYRIVLFDQVFGGSWGSTLALAYSQEHPDKVTGLVLRGIFLLRKKEFDWFYEGGAAAIFPDAWEPFRDFIPEDERNCFVDAYNKRLTSSDPIVQVEAAKRWTMWEMMTAQLIQNNDNIKRGEDDEFSLASPLTQASLLFFAFARIENHYFVNKGFLPSDSFLLDNVDKIRHIKGFIVQVVADAGHSANEVGIAAELRSATDKLRDLLRK
ncbi:Proline iminopeptidase [Zea mays]|uniref:Proline iminopeptidase n=1 Tax=Zea mays TaxID=4577 RepID=A0A1D6M9V0_MAIZE|nr:Proline iminopeptidase [Zea mays]